MEVLPNELIVRRIYLTGEFERSVVKVLSRFFRPRNIVLDRFDSNLYSQRLPLQ